VLKIAIASGKGGTGKTTVATNLASYLAGSENVVIADLDAEEPNTGLFLSGDSLFEEAKYKDRPQWNESTCLLCGKCQEVCNFNAVMQLASQILVFPELCHSCFACSELCPTGSLPMVQDRIGEVKGYRNGRLTLVESRLDIGQEQSVPLIAQTKNLVAERFAQSDLVIFDSPPGTSCPVIEATRDADLVLLVTEPTPFGMNDLILAINTMKELKKIFAVIVNRTGIGDNAVFDYCARENIDIIARIPDSRQIATLYSRAKLIYTEVEEFREEMENINMYIKKHIKTVS
jgi:MinD superfamily P-loop ATPase